MDNLIDGWNRQSIGVKWLVGFTAALVVSAYLIGLALAETGGANAPQDHTLLIIGISTFLSPLLLVILNSWVSRRQRHDEAEDRIRQKRLEVEEHKQEKLAEAAERRQDLRDLWKRQDDQAAEQRAFQAEAAAVAKATALKIDGLLSDRDKANEEEGRRKATLAGEELARTLAEGQKQGRDNERASAGNERASAAASDLQQGRKPIDVEDDRTAKLVLRSAVALERTADVAVAAAARAAEVADKTDAAADQAAEAVAADKADKQK